MVAIDNWSKAWILILTSFFDEFNMNLNNYGQKKSRNYLLLLFISEQAEITYI